MMTAATSRPALRWHGGKWLLAPWIIDHMPDHRCYVEPFGGAASVLLRKPRAHAEIYNDLDDDLVNLFSVLRDPEQAGKLHQLLALTPFARTEWRAAYQATTEPIERARRLIIRSFQGFGSTGTRIDKITGFRASSTRSGTTPARDWANYPDAMAALIDRMRGVIIEQRDAIKVMRQHYASGTLHYVDPPYLDCTRGQQGGRAKHQYTHELTEAQHIELLADLRQLRGMVILSGYPAPLYDEALPGWRRIEKLALADGARPRVEVLWLNPACRDALDRYSLLNHIQPAAPAEAIIC